MTAKLSGALSGEIASVRCGTKFYIVAPERLVAGGVREVQAGSLTDCLHEAVRGFEKSARRRKCSGQ